MEDKIHTIQPLLTISIPCWGRPLRTKRAIECILSQDINGWEALIGGDDCPYFQELIDSGYLEDVKKRAEEKGNILEYYQWMPHEGGCGYKITNHNIQNAKGKYIIFYANDDLILPSHFSNYLEIQHTDLDYMYFDSYVAPIKQPRISKLAPSQIGHSEIIVRTSVAQKARPHNPKYGHDWDFIYDIINIGKGKKSESNLTTYHVMHVPSFGTVDKID